MFLSLRSIKSVVIEKRPGTSNCARAFAVNPRTMEHMRRVGLEDTFQRRSYPRNEPVYLQVSVNMFDSVLLGLRLLSWGDVADGKDGRTFPSFDLNDSICPSMLCPQFAQEPVLEDGLRSRPETSIMWGWEATSLVQDEEGVTLVIRDTAGKEKKLRGKYLLGCDGGKSWVRKSIGIHTYGRFVVQRACSITFKSPELLAKLQKEKKMGFYTLVDPVTFGIIISLNNDGMFAYHNILPPNTTDEQLNERCQQAKEFTQLAIGRNDIPITITDASPYNMHALISTKYRVGRVLLVGDAAHQWLPVGGLGLNTGIGDASNLGWKIEAMVRGWGGKNLLDSYELERVKIADANRRVALAPTGTSLFTAPSVLATLARTPLVNTLIGAIFNIANKSFLNVVNNSILGFQYTQSNIICHEAISTNQLVMTNKFVPSSLPGCRAPHVILPDYPTILDIFGKCFILLIIGGDQSNCLLLQEGLTKHGVPFDVKVISSSPEVLQHYDCKYYLVRPDGIVAWRSNYQPGALEVDETIVPVVRGDAPYTNKPKSSSLSTQSPRFGFLFDIGVSAVVAGLLHQRFGSSIPFRELLISGLAGASALTVFRGWLERRQQNPPFVQQVSRHTAWLTTQFGHATNALTMDRRFVTTFGPKDVVIRVHAASINPIDTMLRQGYGSAMLSSAAAAAGRNLFPLVLGRDCSGEVVAVGDEVVKYSPGDKVFAAVSVHRNGTHAEYTCVDENEVATKPRGISHKEAASLPWVAVTVWTALVQHAGLTPENAKGKRVLVHAGSGGVGCFAVQLLKGWGATITATCSANNKAFVKSLGADIVLDYKTDDLSSLPKHYDVVLDSTQHNEHVSLKLLKLYRGGVYVSLRSPGPYFSSQFGGFLGSLIFQSYYRFKIVSNRIFGGRGFHYSVAQPSGNTLRAVTKLIETGAIKPILGAVYSMDEMVAAHQHVEGGHTRGKVVVSVFEEH